MGGLLKQSRGTSFLKSIISTAVGFALSLFLQWLILPYLIGAPISLHANLTFAAIMTAVSIARGYLLERFFEMIGWRHRLTPFMQAVLAECFRQRDVEGYDATHDDNHLPGELAQAGAAYAMALTSTVISKNGATIPINGRNLWPWQDAMWKAIDPRRNFVKSAALVIAEGDRFDRNRKKKAEWACR